MLACFSLSTQVGLVRHSPNQERTVGDPIFLFTSRLARLVYADRFSHAHRQRTSSNLFSGIASVIFSPYNEASVIVGAAIVAAAILAQVVYSRQPHDLSRGSSNVRWDLAPIADEAGNYCISAPPL